MLSVTVLTTPLPLRDRTVFAFTVDGKHVVASRARHADERQRRHQSRAVQGRGPVAVALVLEQLDGAHAPAPTGEIHPDEFIAQRDDLFGRTRLLGLYLGLVRWFGTLLRRFAPFPSVAPERS